MKLYSFPVAPNPARVEFYLTEKGIALEKVVVNLAEGEQLTKNPSTWRATPRAFCLFWS